MDVNLLAQALISLEYAFGVRPAESLLVLSDATMSSAILDAFAPAGWALGASVIGMSHALLEPIAMRDQFDVDGQSIVDEGGAVHIEQSESAAVAELVVWQDRRLEPMRSTPSPTSRSSASSIPP